MLHDTEVRCFNARECAKRARRADAVAEAMARIQENEYQLRRLRAINERNSRP